MDEKVVQLKVHSLYCKVFSSVAAALLPLLTLKKRQVTNARRLTNNNAHKLFILSPGYSADYGRLPAALHYSCGEVLASGVGLIFTFEGGRQSHLQEGSRACSTSLNLGANRVI